MEQQKNSTPFKVRAKTHHLDAMAKMEKAERARIQNTKDLTQLTRTQITIRQKMVRGFYYVWCIPNTTQLIINRWKNSSSDGWRHRTQST